MRIALTGASGLIGRALATALAADGHDLWPLVRRPLRPSEHAISWDPAAGRLDPAALEGVDAVIHLAGESIAAGRWTAARMAAIRDSRVAGTALLARTLAGLARKPAVWLSASAVGLYGSRGDEVLTESSPAGHGFLADVCSAWEAATLPARDAGIRVVHLRIGVVLAGAGGALAKMLLPFRLGLGGRLGDGRQYMSWIALDDLVAATRLLLAEPAVAGPVNLVAPSPVTNADFTRTLGRVLGRPTLLPAPAFALRLALGRMADEALLASTRVHPQVLLDRGFRFAFAELEPALRHALGR